MAKRQNEQVPIDHARVTDSFGELRGRTHYDGYEADCGRCGARFLFTAAAQKHVHEIRGVPVSKAYSAAYCPSCAAARGRENQSRGRGERAHQRHVELLHAAARAQAAADAAPSDGAKLLEYVVAKLRVLEQDWSLRAAQRLLGDVRRVRRLAPHLAGVNKWESRIRELLGRNSRADQ